MNVSLSGAPGDRQSRAPGPDAKAEAQVSSAARPSCQGQPRHRTEEARALVLRGRSWPLPHSSHVAGRCSPAAAQGIGGRAGAHPGAPDSRASVPRRPQTTRFSWKKKKKNPRVNKFWKQRVVCPTLRERHIAVAFQGSDKSCSEERRFALFHPMLPKLD